MANLMKDATIIIYNSRVILRISVHCDLNYYRRGFIRLAIGKRK